MLRGIKHYSSVSLIESFIKIEVWKCICTTNAFLRTCKCLFVFGTHFLTFKNIPSLVFHWEQEFLMGMKKLFFKPFSQKGIIIVRLIIIQKQKIFQMELNHILLDFISDTQDQYFWASNYQVLFSWHLQQ